jgi:hypothetical protein
VHKKPHSIHKNEAPPPFLLLIFTLVGPLHLPPRPPHHLTPSPHPNSQKKYPTIFILISGLRVKGKESHPYLRNNRRVRQCWWLRPALLAALAVETRCAEPSCPVMCVCVCARACVVQNEEECMSTCTCAKLAQADLTSKVDFGERV